jgi:predicted site-specific integrase-resolvase
MRLLDAKQTAERLSVPSGTLRYWRSAGIGPPYVKLGGRVKYGEADVEAYIEAKKRKPSVRATLERKRIGNLSA